ncbi:MAG: ATP-binding cassette domain-containing protein [Clostridiales bacterium]|jgi:ABC-type multidrug transport system ATPase subunit/pSer/pThr/pTyr-binding forkhead associated (FHA) protein|nr:ATP-binding cassette domain-containing protein [Clostridiales bacterium]
MSPQETRHQTLVRPKNASAPASMFLTVFDGSADPYEMNLSVFGKDIITFGWDPANDIVLRSRVVSGLHGRLISLGGEYAIEGLGGENGLLFRGRHLKRMILNEGDAIQIENYVNNVLFFYSKQGGQIWKNFMVSGAKEITIGRDASCDIQLENIRVSGQHAKIVFKRGQYYLAAHRTAGPLLVNGEKTEGWRPLFEKDLLLAASAKIVFSHAKIFYGGDVSGIRLEALGVTQKVKRSGQIICNRVSLRVNSGELAAIAGGSGVGKTTLLNCLSGCSRPASGKVLLNGIDLYRHLNALRGIIGFVPQTDILYDRLTVYDMLYYTARLRLSSELSSQDLRDVIGSVLDSVDLTGKSNETIKDLSHGQRKRVSIAAELLASPSLFFLDEPVSGLDPGTERSLMNTLKKIAVSGRTVILVTHSTLRLALCDKLIFLGAGGQLCFYGSYPEALRFFGVDDITDVYAAAAENPEKWKNQYLSALPYAADQDQRDEIEKLPELNNSVKKSWIRQTVILTQRQLQLLWNDKIRMLLILLQAPALSLLISFAADGRQFIQYRITKSLLFTLSCSAFWIGMLNSLQEIGKERSILWREYMTGLKLSAYIFSKVLIMAFICAVESFLLTTVFVCLIGQPTSGGAFLHPFAEMLIAVFLTALAASAMGLFVSAFFKSADKAAIAAPLLLLPQLLFSGLIFNLEGVTSILSWFAVCRWSMESLGTTANLNELEIATPPGLPRTPGFEEFYLFAGDHLFWSWVHLEIFILAFSLLAGIVLRNSKLESR